MVTDGAILIIVKKEINIYTYICVCIQSLTSQKHTMQFHAEIFPSLTAAHLSLNSHKGETSLVHQPVCHGRGDRDTVTLIHQSTMQSQLVYLYICYW